MSMVFTLGLALMAAASYLGAALVLKQWSVLPVWIATALVAMCLAAACVFELMALQRARFAEVVVLIIALEVGFALVVSHRMFSEAYGMRELLGLGLLVMGVFVLLTGQAPASGERVAMSDLRES